MVTNNPTIEDKEEKQKKLFSSVPRTQTNKKKESVNWAYGLGTFVIMSGE